MPLPDEHRVMNRLLRRRGRPEPEPKADEGPKTRSVPSIGAGEGRRQRPSRRSADMNVLIRRLAGREPDNEGFPKQGLR